MINFVGTPRVKNHVNSCHGSHAFFHIEIEFIFAGKTFLHLNLCNLVKHSSNNIFQAILGSDHDKQMKRFINITESRYFGGHFENMQIRT